MKEMEEHDSEIQLFNESDDYDWSENKSKQICYSSKPFPHHRRERKILSKASRTVNHRSTEAEFFFLYNDKTHVEIIATIHESKSSPRP